MHQWPAGDSQQREPIQDPPLPSCWPGQAGRGLPTVEVLQGNSAQRPGQVTIQNPVWHLVLLGNKDIFQPFPFSIQILVLCPRFLFCFYFFFKSVISHSLFLFPSLFLSLFPSGVKWEILHAVFHPEAHLTVSGDPPRGEALSATGCHHLASSSQPQWAGGGGI